MKKVAVLGETGKLGRALKRYWAAHPPAGVSLSWHDRAVRTDGLPQVGAVIALWGVTSGDAALLAQNAALAEEAQRLADAAGAELVLHLSSAAVYGAQAGALSEDAKLLPANPYGAAKADMERAVMASNGPRGICLRIANVAGSDSLFRNLAQGGAIELDRFEGGAGPWRSYIAVPELARVFEALIGAEPSALPGVLNVAAPEPQAMEAIARAAGRDVMWRPAGAGAIEHVALDVTRLMKLAPMGPEASDAAHLVAAWRDFGGWG